MRLSIIIVTYNVSGFLDQCLDSVFRASKSIDSEVLVVDNHSVDQTLLMLKTKYPSVQVIANQENVGFGKANNQAIKEAAGDFVLILNPDTIVSEDCFETCLAFMTSQEKIGALGVKMMDGSGNYLPESKRGFPSPLASLTKMTGIYKLFPHSAALNKYYLGHLSPDQTNKVDVLTGAFMMIPRKVLQEVAGFDEAFFMYGEDIDLSYRIAQAGYVNYYLPDTTIIHYKGESTKKASLNYYRTFYSAMIVFAQKHFKGPQSWLLIQILKIGIYFTAISKYLTSVVSKGLPFILDTLVIIGSLFAAKALWANFYYLNSEHFDVNFYKVNVPLYAILWLLGLYVRGAYAKRHRYWSFFSGILLGTLAILIVYALIAETYRSSRMVIILSAVLILILGSILRRILHRSVRGTAQTKKKVLVVADIEESQRLQELINRSSTNVEVLGTISPNAEIFSNAYLNHIGELDEVAQVYKADEIIFSTVDLDFSDITKWMTTLGAKYQYKLASKESWQIIGSKSKNNPGEWYGLDIEHKLDHQLSRRNKRLFDLFSGLFILILSPVFILIVKERGQFFENVWNVILGKYTWVGYDSNDEKRSELPKLKPAVIPTTMDSDRLGKGTTDKMIHNINYLYARDYSTWQDLEVLLKNLSNTGNIPNDK